MRTEVRKQISMSFTEVPIQTNKKLQENMQKKALMNFNNCT